MKSKSLLFVSFVLIQTGVFSQELWPHENAEWWSQITYYLFLPAWEHSYVDGDTLINNVNCTRITSDRYWSYNPNSNDLNLHATDEEFVYFNGDTLFWWKFDAFYPLVCFNAQVGDSWFPFPQDDSFGCDYNPVTVESTETVFYNGEPYRKLTISPYDELTSTFYWGGSFDERTFWREFSYPAYHACGSIVEWFTYTFRCYNDNQLSINESGGACDAPLSVGSLVDQSAFNVYPNPVEPGQQLITEGAQVLSLISLTGQRLNFDN
ncbi:MAG TPA: hypothetical protein VJ949_13145 [Cryomorphaceae bacterium]|nr:hypothetical protein [Cryomorphaceae bacterium]